MTHTKRSNNKYEVVLRFGVNRGHEYVFATGIRREAGAEAERDKMVAETVSNMADHCKGGHVVQGAHPSDPNAVVVAAVHPDGGPVVYKVVTYRTPVAEDPNALEDALLASLMVVNG